MRVGINATSFTDRPSGARQRFVGLYGALFRARPANDYVIYEPRDCRVADWFGGLANVRGFPTPLAGDDRWQRLVRGFSYWRHRLTADRLDLFEALHLPLIRAPGCPTLLTLHDARPVATDIPASRRRLNRALMQWSMRSADLVVTVSETMRQELLSIEPTALIATIHNGIDPAPFQQASPDPEYPSHFLLAVGHFEPRKNYPALIAAMALLGPGHPGLGLKIVGKDGGSLAETRALVDRLGLGTRIALMTAVDDRQLIALYRAARMLVFPSTYEGFGIPVLEAMAAGCPLCLSDTAVFRELTEDAGAYFPPGDPRAMAGAIAGLLESPERQREAIAYGRRRVGDFAFVTLAEQLDHLHRGLVSRPASAGQPAPAPLSPPGAPTGRPCIMTNPPPARPSRR